MVSALIAGLARVNPLATVLDTIPHDRAMGRLHNFMKDDPGFRTDPIGYRQIRFPPLSAWMVFTDGVSHASLEGQFALVTTLIVRRAQMRFPERASHQALLTRAAGSCPATKSSGIRASGREISSSPTEMWEISAGAQKKAAGLPRPPVNA